MKKSLVALAALAVVGAASAQSSVTIYGRAELGARHNGATPTTGSSNQMETSNGTSRIGFTGVEDLGGGLKATFKLETRMGLESGSNDGTNGARPFWQGESTVGLAGGFGSVRLGRALTAYRNIDSSGDPWGTEKVASLAPASVKSDTTNATSVAGVVTPDSAYSDGGGLARTDGIHWVSNDYSGFKGALSFGFKSQSPAVTGQQRLANAITGTTPAAGSVPYAPGTKSDISAAIWYAQGPIYIGGGYEQNRRDETGWTVAGSYDFGGMMGASGLKLMAAYTVKDTAIAGPDYKATSLAVVIPFGAFTFKGGYIDAKAEGSGSKTGNSKLGLGLDYALSKRTSLYSAYGDPKGPIKASYEIGINHTF